MKLLVSAYRFRTVIYFLSVVAFVALTALGTVPSNQTLKMALTASALISLGIFFATIVLIFAGKKLRPIYGLAVVTAPVTGHWLGRNSPQSKTPSHGVHSLGQTYAIDLIHDPGRSGRRPVSKGLGMHPLSEYESYGQPVVAMISGEVVHASGWRRDHKSRSSVFAIVYLMIEAMLRELGGPGFILGNHVIIRGANGIYAAVGHLKQGSVRVVQGQQVQAGQIVGQCGNSGNSSEPHVHAQLMDRANPSSAFGIPMAYKDIHIDGSPAPKPTVPANNQTMTAKSS